jgi:molybdopterin converting factor subunit 1
MKLTVKLFGALREALGRPELSLELPEGTSVGELRRTLGREHPAFERYGERLATSVNMEVVPPETRLQEGDEVAFLPPVAGGAGDCWLSESPLEVEQVLARVAGPGRGGLVTFLGTVRDHARGRSIRHLEYEAYPGMAEREMEKIAATAAERWPGVRVAIAHRTGRLEIGEVAVAIAAAGPHREEAFAACRFAIDTLKQTVPIWKKEFARDGDYWVEDRP